MHKIICVYWAHKPFIYLCYCVTILKLLCGKINIQENTKKSQMLQQSRSCEWYFLLHFTHLPCNYASAQHQVRRCVCVCARWVLYNGEYFASTVSGFITRLCHHATRRRRNNHSESCSGGGREQTTHSLSVRPSTIIIFLAEQRAVRKSASAKMHKYVFLIDSLATFHAPSARRRWCWQLGKSPPASSTTFSFNCTNLNRRA